ncbi:hypothetical protein CLCR_09365 [Cladophialophora carrionii]|uniref:Uncharacterized protein n=1 Tax=Cladophialophora carrionii TaxID=86049 RepID=A0A1C1CRF4_9EURO|nr:hypothetical protein CLCR_09365 [Cladophialophora carrionii]
MASRKVARERESDMQMCQAGNVGVAAMQDRHSQSILRREQRNESMHTDGPQKPCNQIKTTKATRTIPAAPACVLEAN